MKKRKLYLTKEEWQVAIHALNDLRNKRIQEGKSTYSTPSAIDNHLEVLYEIERSL